MKHFLLLTVEHSTLLCLTVLLVSSTNVIGKGLQQPAAVVKVSVERDSQVKPTGCCDGGSGCGSCCRCEPVCCPRCVVGEVEKKCWNVKYEPVCIPKFRWPWECWGKSEDGCASDTCCGDARGCTLPKCGRVRSVNVLEEHMYTCKKCGYEWDIRCVCVPKKKHH